MDPASATGLSELATNSVPAFEVVPTNGLHQSIATSSAVMWRVVNARHRLVFTGSALNNGGSVTITPVSLTAGRQLEVGGTGSSVVTHVGAASFRINNSTVAGPAKDS